MLIDNRLLQMWENLAFNKLLRAFPVAVSPTRMTLGLMALGSIALIGWVMDLCSLSVTVKIESATGTKAGTALRMIYASELDRTILDYGGRMTALVDKISAEPRPSGQPIPPIRLGVFTSLWRFGSAHFNEATICLLRPNGTSIIQDASDVLKHIQMFGIGFLWAFRYHPLYSLFFFIFSGLIVCLFGGAICRSAALDYGRGEKPGLFEVLGYSIRKFRSFLAAPLLAVGIMAGMGLFVLVLGMMANCPWGIGEILLSLGLGIALIFGLLTVLMMIGTAAGANLMFPVIAYEGSDGFDALSRSLRYVFSRPFWAIFYDLAAALYGIVCYVIVRFFAYLVLLTTYGLIRLGVYSTLESQRLSRLQRLDRLWSCPDFFFLIGPEGSPQGWSETVAHIVIRLTLLFVVGLVVAFVISFVFSANTIIYSLLRRHIDRISTQKVHVKLDEVRDMRIRLEAETPNPSGADPSLRES